MSFMRSAVSATMGDPFSGLLVARGFGHKRMSWMLVMKENKIIYATANYKI
jgi:hypothetical protein